MSKNLDSKVTWRIVFEYSQAENYRAFLHHYHRRYRKNCIFRFTFYVTPPIFLPWQHRGRYQYNFVCCHKNQKEELKEKNNNLGFSKNFLVFLVFILLFLWHSHFSNAQFIFAMPSHMSHKKKSHSISLNWAVLHFLICAPFLWGWTLPMNKQ